MGGWSRHARRERQRPPRRRPGRRQPGGGAGNDRIDGGDGRNRYYGGSGNDVIDAANGSVETVNCGPGRDTVRADSRDRLIRCERVHRLTLARR